MVGRVHAGVDLRDSSAGIDQEGMACGKLCDCKIGERSVGSGDFAARVGKKSEIESLLGAEVFVGVDGVETDSENDGIVRGVFWLIHLKLVGFFRSTRGLIFGIEVQDDPFSAEVF